jgi:DNA modification methylase
VTDIRNRIREVRRVRFGDVQAHPLNFRRHPKHQRAALEGVVADVGFATVPLAYHSERNGGALTWLDGHLRSEAFPAYEGDVGVLDVNDAEAALLLATLDPIAALATADATQLEALLQTVNTGEAAVQELLANMAEEAGILKPELVQDVEPQVDRAEELRQKWGVESGDLWLLGDHRLICGDCTNAAVVERVMGGEKAALVWADPPFGIQYTGHGASVDGRANKFNAIQGDDKPTGNWLPLALPVSGGAIYLKTTWAVLSDWEAMLSTVASLKSRIVWDKCSHVAGDVLGGYATQSEIILFAAVGKHKITRFDTDVWRVARATTGSPEQRTGHPYESPVKLPCRAIENSSSVGDSVLDPFCGSGTTIMACEQLGRKCRAIEISPAYVAVALERWATATGRTPVKG